MNEIRIANPYLRRILYVIAGLVVVLLAFQAFALLKNGIIFVLNVLTPFLAALLLAYILAPAVVGLQQNLKMGRIASTLVLYLMIFAVIFLLLAVIIPRLVSEFIELFNTLKVVIPDLLQRLSQSKYLKLSDEMVASVQQKIQEIEIDLEKITSYVIPGLQRMATGGFEAVGIATRGFFTGVGAVVGFFSFLILVGIINFYFLVDWEKISPLMRKMVPPQRRERFFEVLGKLDNAVGGFLRGQLTVSVMVGSMFAVGLFVMGFLGFPALRNYSILIGTVAAIGGFVPYLGAVMGVTPALLIVVFSSGIPWSIKLIALLIVLGLFSAIQAIEGFILQPKIVGKGAGLHPLAVMLALFVGAQVGIGGMIVAVPVASMIRVFLHEFYWLPIERREAELARAPESTSADSPE